MNPSTDHGLRDEFEFHGLLVASPVLTVDEVAFLEQLADAQLQMSPLGSREEPPPPLPQLVGRPPDGVCGWASCGHGCCLWVDDAGRATVSSVTLWMRYLIRHHLGRAHTLDGVVVARSRFTTETCAIRVRANQVERIRLCGPDPRYRGHWDEWGDPSPPPERQTSPARSPQPSTVRAEVIDLASRRQGG